MTKSLIEELNTIEVEINSRCNRKCYYCPVSILPISNVPRYMSDEVFERLLSELRAISFTGRFSYHFYNEPLLRKDLERMVVWAHIELPNMHQVLFTNGDLLNDKRYASLLDAGIELFVVTAHSGLSYPKRPHQIVQYPDDLQLTNRGGIMSNLPKAPPSTKKMPCFAPSEMLIVTVTGDVVLCYEDAERKYIMGNIMENSIEKIWFTSEFVEIRNRVAKGHRTQAAPICHVCSNLAHTIRGTSDQP